MDPLLIPSSILFGALGLIALKNNKPVEGLLMLSTGIASCIYYSVGGRTLQNIDIFVSYTVGILLILYVRNWIVTLLIFSCWCAYKMNGEGNGSSLGHLCFVHSIAIVTFAYIATSNFE